MKRVKLIVFIAVILLSGITTVFTYATLTPSSPGSTMIIVTNPPYTSKVWQFFAYTQVDVYYENISNYMTILSVDCANTSTSTEYYTLLPKDMTGVVQYSTTPYVNNPPVEWAFTLGVSSRAQIVGHASWK